MLGGFGRRKSRDISKTSKETFVKHKTLAVVLALCAISILAGFMLGGCGVQPLSEWGSIALAIDPHASIQTIDPPISMTAGSYDVTVSGGPSPDQSFNTTDTDIVIDRLLPGTYTVAIIAMNDEDPAIAIGAGSNTAEVEIGLVNPVTVTVSEYTDTAGSLHLDLEWDPPVVSDPIWDLRTKNFTGTVTAMTLSNIDAVAGTAEADQAGMAVGWHAVIGELYDGTVKTSGFADVARIVNGRESSAYIWTAANAAEGGIQILIESDFFEDLDLEADLAESAALEIYTGDEITITTSAGEAYVATWYLNGAAVAVDEAAYTLLATDLQEGNTYRLDVVAFSLDGKKAAAMSWSFLKVVLDPETNTLSGSVTVPLTFVTDPTFSGKPAIIELRKDGVAVAWSAATTLATAAKPFDFGLRFDGSWHVLYFLDNDGSGTYTSGDYRDNNAYRYVTMPRATPFTFEIEGFTASPLP